MFRTIGIITIVVGLVAVGYFFLSPSFLDTADEEGSSQQADSQTSSDQAGSDADLALVSDTMVFTRLEVDVASDTPEACLVFSQDLDTSGDVNYADYMSSQPAIKPALRVAGPLLCLGGLEFEQTYTVTLREGLPSASGARMAFDEQVPVELRDRPSAVSFGGGIILPRESGGNVPLTTMNIDTVSIRVLRVGDRLLARLEQGLLDRQELYSYSAQELENSQGAIIWEGEMDVARIDNQAVTTGFPIAQVLEGQGPGAYVILAEDGGPETRNTQDYYRATASQWIIETDLGLTTFWGQDGLHVFVRSLEDAATSSGVELRLVARNNEVLGTQRTSGNGAVVFDAGLVRGTGGMEPVAVMAYGRNGDFAYLDLRRPAFDLSDRGVSGRATPGPIDAYLYTERGVYRPGEDVELVTLLRNQRSVALDNVPLTIVVNRPDGMEFIRETIADQDAGAVHFPIHLSNTAPLGMWRASAFVDTGAAAVGQVRFEVQNFVPEQLEVTATPENAVLHRGDDVAVNVSARFLYGAAAAGLDGEAELRLEHDRAPFEGYEEFVFGRIEEVLDAQLWPLEFAATDADGLSVARGSLNGLPFTTWPLVAHARIGVYQPGGRASRAVAEISIRTRENYLGIRPAFEGRFVRQGSPAAFEIVSLDDAGTRVALENVSWQIVHEVVNYQWYELDGRWRFERIVQDRALSAGILSTATDEIAEISETLPWGTYRVIVTDADGVNSSSTRFYVGWWGASSADRPDQLIVTSQSPSYAPGSTAEITLRPTVAGPALVVVANDHVLETHHVDVPAEGMTLDLDVTEEWGAGAYVLVTHYRALATGDARAPVRSVGLAWVDVDVSDRVLEIVLDTPTRVTPQQTITVPVQVSNLDGEQAYLTLAAVDQGILQLTQFNSPNPEDHYFGKRRLGVDMRDDYGRLIQASTAATGAIRSGGDAMFGGGGLTVVPTRTVALFSGLVELDAQGRAEVELDIPDFVGELRLMAVGVSETKVGQGVQSLTVRDDVVGELTLPRFLAPGDQAQATLSVHNVSGAAGTYMANVTTSGEVEAIRTQTYEVELGLGERQEIYVTLQGVDIGIGTVQLALSGPAGMDRTREWPIEVRSAQRVEVQEDVALLSAGSNFVIPVTALEGFVPSTASVSLSLSTTRGLDTGGLLRSLSRYPFGCLEQSVSRAFPLLFYTDLAEEIGLDDSDNASGDEVIDVRLQNAVNSVLDMQRGNGAFGMWGTHGAEADAWLSLYALDFLFAAKSQGHVVPDDALRRGLSWAGTQATQSWRDANVRAYAFYILARQGRVVPGDLRYFHDTLRGGLTDVMALSHLGAALDAMGDRARAASTFDQALRLAQAADPSTYEASAYGTLTRDVAGLTALATLGGRLTLLPALFDRLGQLAPRLEYTTTQEQSWLLFAAMALRVSDMELDVTVQNVSIVSGDDPVFVAPTNAELASGVSIQNNGQDIWRSQTSVGVPDTPQAADANGFSLSRRVLNLDGTLADLESVRQNDQLIVLIQGRMENNIYREMAVMDLLPAGFEIETVLSTGSNSWLPVLSATRFAEARDDRFVAAFDMGNRYRPHALDSEDRVIRPSFAVAYQVRAITPGSFVQPPAYVEDMYDPHTHARTAMGQVTVSRGN